MVSDIYEAWKGQEDAKKGFSTADFEYGSIEGLMQQVQSIAAKYDLEREAIDNPCTNLTITSISNKWTEVKKLVLQRNQVLQAKLVKQQSSWIFHQAFAAKANTVSPWFKRQSDAIASIPLQTQGTLELKLQHLRLYQASR